MLRKNWVHYLFIIIICIFSFFVNNREVYVGIMESRNLVTAHEMIEYDNWLIPTMNGELRMEKPPLPTWVAAVIEMISPDNIGLQRAAAGTMATIMVFFLYFLTTGITRNRLTGLLAALVLATSFNVVLAGRSATWDIYCHSFMLGGIFFFWRATSALRTRWWDFVLTGLFMGLSFLGKGPVAFYALLLPFLITYLMIYRPSFRHRWWPLVVMILVFCLISFWWPVYLYFNHPEDAVGALTKESTAWMERNVRPWYYYWLFFAESGIWSLFLLTGLIGWPWLRKKITEHKAYTFAVAWTVLTIVLLSLFPEKKTRYLLPMLIPAAMVVGHYLSYIFNAEKNNNLTRDDKIIFRINAFLPVFIALVAPVGLYLMFYKTGQISLTFLIIVSVIFLFSALSISVGGVKLKTIKVFTGIMVLMIVVETMLMPFLADTVNNTEKKSIRAVREIEAVQGKPFYHPANEELRIELVYEAGRRIRPWSIATDHSLLDSLPIVLVSEKPAEEILPPEILEQVTLQVVDRYDNNNRKKETKRYNPKFVKYVTVLEKDYTR